MNNSFQSLLRQITEFCFFCHGNSRIIRQLAALIVMADLIMVTPVIARLHADIIVSQAGEGDFLTITEALDALPMYPYQRTIILIRNGIYQEKIRIDHHYITLRGENRESTIIRYAQLRSDWQKNRDYIGPAVVNLHGDDIVLSHLTIENSQKEIGPHAFAVYGDGTRTLITECDIKSKGGDTVSLWNYKSGMYYFSHCRFEGAVDFVCPRGWCFIRDSEFYEVKDTAAIWHDGHYHPEQKFVIVKSSFDGVKQFQLGRHHYEAQFFLIECQFSINMADRPIYRNTYDDDSRNNPYYWGNRKYFYGCQKQGETFEWTKDNLAESDKNLTAEMITPVWTFSGKWDPESEASVQITNGSIRDREVVVTFGEIVTVRGNPVIVTSTGKELLIVKQRFNDINRLSFRSDDPLAIQDLDGMMTITNGQIIASVASITERSLGTEFQIDVKDESI
ncbi:pectin esterase [bacterium]|nr:pectin esterase [bacterium]